MLKPIKTEEQYDGALARIYDLIQADVPEGTSEADELEVLIILVKASGDQHYPTPSPNPLEAIKFRLEQMGMSEKELAHISGYRSWKSELLSGKRKLRLAMIRKLNEVLLIPAQVLIQAY